MLYRDGQPVNATHDKVIYEGGTQSIILDYTLSGSPANLARILIIPGEWDIPIALEDRPAEPLPGWALWRIRLDFNADSYGDRPALVYVGTPGSPERPELAGMVRWVVPNYPPGAAKPVGFTVWTLTIGLAWPTVAA